MLGGRPRFSDWLIERTDVFPEATGLIFGSVAVFAGGLMGFRRWVFPSTRTLPPHMGPTTAGEELQMVFSETCEKDEWKQGLQPRLSPHRFSVQILNRRLPDFKALVA